MRDFETRVIAGEIVGMLSELAAHVARDAAMFAKREGHHVRSVHRVIHPGMPHLVLQADVVGYNEHVSPPSMVDRLERQIAKDKLSLEMYVARERDYRARIEELASMLEVNTRGAKRSVRKRVMRAIGKP